MCREGAWAELAATVTLVARVRSETHGLKLNRMIAICSHPVIFFVKGIAAIHALKRRAAGFLCHAVSQAAREVKVPSGPAAAVVAWRVL